MRKRGYISATQRGKAFFLTSVTIWSIFPLDSPCELNLASDPRTFERLTESCDPLAIDRYRTNEGQWMNDWTNLIWEHGNAIRNTDDTVRKINTFKKSCADLSISSMTLDWVQFLAPLGASHFRTLSRRSLTDERLCKMERRDPIPRTIWLGISGKTGRKNWRKKCRLSSYVEPSFNSFVSRFSPQTQQITIFLAAFHRFRYFHGHDPSDIQQSIAGWNLTNDIYPALLSAWWPRSVFNVLSK